jgi:hypothetical protein
VDFSATASILNENQNKCRSITFNRKYVNIDNQLWGLPLHKFNTFSSLEHYIYDGNLVINIDIIKLDRTPNDKVLLYRIYRAVNANEQSLFDKKLKTQENCNKQIMDINQTLHVKIDSLNDEIEKLKLTLNTTNDSNNSTNSSTNSSNSNNTIDIEQHTHEPYNKIDLTKFDDEQLNELQQSILTEIKKRETCVVCLNSKINIAFIPCGHRKVCNICSEKLNDCPICRCKITQKIKTF